MPDDSEAPVVATLQRIEGSRHPTIAVVPFPLAQKVVEIVGPAMTRWILFTVSVRARVEHADLDALAARARRSLDAKEGVRAMLEKRKPVFRGE